MEYIKFDSSIKDIYRYLYMYDIRLYEQDKYTEIFENITMNLNNSDKVISILQKNPKIDNLKVLFIYDAFINIYNSLLNEFIKIKNFFDDGKKNKNYFRENKIV
jgi:hypothetical protein